MQVRSSKVSVLQFCVIYRLYVALHFLFLCLPWKQIAGKWWLFQISIVPVCCQDLVVLLHATKIVEGYVVMHLRLPSLAQLKQCVVCLAAKTRTMHFVAYVHSLK